MYYIYQFYNKDYDIIYIGKTKRDIKQRMHEHFGPHGHLNCYDEVTSIKYYSFLTEKEMDIAEAYLILKHKPCYNKKRERINKYEIKYIEKRIQQNELVTLEEKLWQQEYSIQQKQKTTVLNQLYLKLKNTLENLISTN